MRHAHRGGLAGAVGAEQAGDFTVARLEADIVDRDHGGLVLALAGEGLAEVFGCDHGALLMGMRGVRGVKGTKASGGVAVVGAMQGRRELGRAWCRERGCRYVSI